jgi:hypothetical protein
MAAKALWIRFPLRPASMSIFVLLFETNRLFPELPLYKLQNFNRCSLVHFLKTSVKSFHLNAPRASWIVMFILAKDA